MSKSFDRVLSAFLAGKPARSRNDMTDGQKLFFWSSCIGEHKADGTIRLSHCGHASPSTMSRLNTICERTGNGRPWRVRDFAAQFNNQPAADFHIISLSNR